MGCETSKFLLGTESDYKFKLKDEEDTIDLGNITHGPNTNSDTNKRGSVIKGNFRLSAITSEIANPVNPSKGRKAVPMDKVPDKNTDDYTQDVPKATFNSRDSITPAEYGAIKPIQSLDVAPVS